MPANTIQDRHKNVPHRCDHREEAPGRYAARLGRRGEPDLAPPDSGSIVEEMSATHRASQ